jgi:hypothetical protein
MSSIPMYDAELSDGGDFVEQVEHSIFHLAAFGRENRTKMALVGDIDGA